MIVKNAGCVKHLWLMLSTQIKEKQKRRGKNAYKFEEVAIIFTFWLIGGEFNQRVMMKSINQLTFQGQLLHYG